MQSTYATAASQLSVPSGWSQVWTKNWIGNWDSVASNDCLVETIDYTTTSVFGFVVNVQGNLAAQLEAQAQAHGSQMYGMTLLHRKQNFNITLPSQVCVGPVCIPVPGGGTTIFATDEYRLIACHSQFQFALAVVLILAAAIIGFYAITHQASLPLLIQQITTDLQKLFGGTIGAPFAAAQGELIWFTVAAGVTAIGAYVVLRLTATGVGANPNEVRIPQPPGFAPLSIPNESVNAKAGPVGFGLSTGSRVAPSGTSVRGGGSGGVGLRTSPQSRRQRRTIPLSTQGRAGVGANAAAPSR